MKTTDINYRALVVSERDGTFIQTIKEVNTSNLPAGDVLIRVLYSSLNYKDALSATGNKGVTKKYPHTPGIDACGVIIDSESNLFAPGDKVIVSGYDLGMNTAGGFGEYIRVTSAWWSSCPKAYLQKKQ